MATRKSKTKTYTPDQVRTLMVNAKASVKEALKPLKGNVYKLATTLYNEGVRKAVCGDMEECALAQYLADKINHPHVAVKVHGSAAEIEFTGRMHSDDYYNFDDFDEVVGLKQSLSTFIEAFDEGEFKFLM